SNGSGNGNGHAPVPTPAVPSAPSASDVCLNAPLAALCETWPDAVRHEVEQLNLTGAQLALPVRVVEPALRQGRVAFPWKVVRSWIRPAALPSVSAHDGEMLELPLKVIAPLFLTRQKKGTFGQPQIEVDENIPNLFFGFPQGESAMPIDEEEETPA